MFLIRLNPFKQSRDKNAPIRLQEKFTTAGISKDKRRFPNNMATVENWRGFAVEALKYWYLSSFVSKIAHFSIKYNTCRLDEQNMIIILLASARFLRVFERSILPFKNLCFIMQSIIAFLVHSYAPFTQTMAFIRNNNVLFCLFTCNILPYESAKLRSWMFTWIIFKWKQ